MGIYMGKYVDLEERGRILIPKDIRDTLNLKPGERLLVEVEKERIIISSTISKERFISELSGCVKASKINPLDLKKMWEKL